ncbi:MAG: polymerase III subunit gamma and tau protein [Candidatus Woesebacteria bacterium GW2011_GWA1_41_7]|uniref:DNA polymerase III subunit gamma/tau n=1 Tax=Candidatus Woesebacteria bacterium GW2011_GWA1_41_7 TaxID=1618556 RepID=A0A0G0WWS2_9BACT|nr:MAG: polymerase III subunit gamma and tau protein [Candidatus Woesebacteria bacterium GW2011_GWA1_41_7]
MTNKFMTLYLKYRPKNLDELDLVDVSESLKKIVTKKSIPHAFLFAGPKGTGKTSAARILAKIINCQNVKDGKSCDHCEQCESIAGGSNLDVVEMDAASHRGIDDVRILRDAAKLAPVSAKKKIYIIDEVHMLTTEASNALLKILEEPPEHVVFILATTNPEKLIETIRSRTTIIAFRKARNEEILRSLKRAAKGEGIEIDADSLGLIAEAADGSFRDGIKVLEQLIAEESLLNKEAVGEFLFKNKSFDVDKFVKLLQERKTRELLGEVENLNSKGVSIEFFLESLTKKLRNALLIKVGIGEGNPGNFSKEELIKLISLFNQAYKDTASVPVEELPLELAIISWCEVGGVSGDSEKNDTGSEDIPETKVQSVTVKTGQSKTRDQEKGSDTYIQTQEQVMVGGEIKVEDGAWKNILELVKPINASMEALLRAAKPMTYNGKVLTLGVYYKFHKERLEEAKHRKILEDIVGKVLQSPTKVSCILVDPPPKKIIEEAKIETVLTEGKDGDIVRVAEEIFGS